jgi:UDP-N-acetylmuramoyl-tripeptide--D-alanyl-D-alanine ligase
MKDVHGIPGVEVHNLNFKSASGISTDSRAASAGEIFFALRGEKFDGHDFVGEVLARKVSCAVVDRKWYSRAALDDPSVTGYPLAVVDDTTRALGDLARVYRSKFSMPVIAIAGSNGKTTTKEMAAKILGKRLSVAKTSGNHNNQIGVPLTVFGFRKHHEAAVVEIGTNHFGEIKRLCEILKPGAGLITSIGAEHLEFLKNLNGVKKEETALFDFLRLSSGVLFVNSDDRNIVNMARLFSKRSVRAGHKFSYGFRSDTLERRNLAGRFFGLDRKGCAFFELRYYGKTELIRLKVPGIHTAMDALAAAAIGYYYGLSSSEIRNALETYKGFEKRMQLMRARDVRIMNDTYNSNPESAIAALRWLSVVRTKGRKIAVFADMLELGESAKREHQKVGKEIAKMNLDCLFTFGDLARETACTAEGYASREKRDGLKVEAFDNKERLSEELLRTVTAGDVVLVKGSRGMKMEEVVNALRIELQEKGAH